MSIRISGISKSFGSFRALDDVSLDVPQGTLLALLTLVAKVFIERQLETESQELEAARATGADTDPTTGGDGS